MPTYEYKCPNGHLFEVFHGMTEDGPSACPECSAAPLQRVLYPVAVHYKGSGFYSTDYGRGGKKKPAKDGAASESSSSSSESSSSSNSSSSSSSSSSSENSGGGESKPKTSDS